MIVSIYLKEHEYLTNQPQTLNFGGEYLYNFHSEGDYLLVIRKPNENYIENFFNISDCSCKIKLLSAIVGQNGVGKSTFLDVIRSVFVKNQFSMPDKDATILVEINGITKVLHSTAKIYYYDAKNDEDQIIKKDFTLSIALDKLDDYKKLEKININDYQSIYYSPHFDLKYNINFSEVDKYDISLDNYIKVDLEGLDKKGTNENGWKFELHEELVFKNSMRQIEFLNSPIFKNNLIFKEVFNLPKYNSGILHFRDIEIPDFHNTPFELTTIIKLILDKIENESKAWHEFRDENLKLEKNLRQALVNKYLLERFVLKAFISVVIDQMEKNNTWLEEGRIKDAHDSDRFKDFSAFEVFRYFIENSYIVKGKHKKQIFKKEVILPFFEKLHLLFEKESDPDNITKKSLRLDLDELKEILELHKKIVINLLHYYPKHDELIDKSNYTDGFISFRPTDRNMSSGENALLNFFSKLYNFIQNNLIEESQSLPSKENYILLLDEADLGFHPVWKKKYIHAILSTLPFFFESLEFKPNLQVIITTHDPLTLSDFPNNNVVFLSKDDNYCNVISIDNKNKIHKTFGANITNLLAHSFFVENGLIGDFSKSKIKEIIDWINVNKELPQERKSTDIFKEKLDYHKKVVNLIDEKVVKIKLAEMLTDLVPDNQYFNKIIENEVNYLNNKKR